MILIRYPQSISFIYMSIISNNLNQITNDDNINTRYMCLYTIVETLYELIQRNYLTFQTNQSIHHQGISESHFLCVYLWYIIDSETRQTQRETNTKHRDTPHKNRDIPNIETYKHRDTRIHTPPQTNYTTRK